MAVNTYRPFKNRHALAQRWHSNLGEPILSSRDMLAVVKFSCNVQEGKKSSFKGERGDKGCDLTKGMAVVT